jgi:NitT/TauT family transport system permease protein
MTALPSKKLELWGVVPVGVALAIWEFVARFDFLPGDGLFPPFSEVVRELIFLAGNGVLAENFLPSLRRVVIGLVFGALVGILVGTAMGWKRQLGILDPL